MKKETIGMIVFIIIMATMFMFWLDRMEKINNGEMTIASQNEIDR